METAQADLRIGDYTSEFVGNFVKYEKNEDPVWLSCDYNGRCIVDLKDTSLESKFSSENSLYVGDSPSLPEPNLNSIQHDTPSANILVESIYHGSLDGELDNDELTRHVNLSREIFVKKEDYSRNSYNVAAVETPCEIIEELNLSIKKERRNFESDCSTEDESLKYCETNKSLSSIGLFDNFNKDDIQRRRKTRHALSRLSYCDRLRKKADYMRERRKKLYEEESEEARLSRLSREAAKRRETRMYCETPEQRRKTLDADAARKREFRMYNETPDERRKRLDREAERRRIKRITMYANETPEERRERLNRESSKRREARLNQYAKESEEQRIERLRKDALRAREMRFTRSAIETDEERRERLIKDALRKRELRTHGTSTVRNFTELQTVRNFEELNDSRILDEREDNQLAGHYLSNWMVWFQNSITQPTSNGESSNETQQTDT